MGSYRPRENTMKYGVKMGWLKWAPKLIDSMLERGDLETSESSNRRKRKRPGDVGLS